MLLELKRDCFENPPGGKRRNSRGIFLILPLVAFILVSPPQARARALDGAELRDLALRGIWSANLGYGYWAWKEDNTVCLRLHGPNGKCSDTGTWKIDGNKLCYEYTWWGQGEDMRQLCLTIIALDAGQYEVRHEGEKVTSTIFKFKVLDR